MELRHLRYFTAVAEELNFHKAAERLHISQPPLTVAIQQLEDDIGAPLFIREKRRIHLTPAGRMFLDKTYSILEQVDDASENARNIAAGKSGTLRICFVSSSITGFLQNTVQKFVRKYPDVRLEMKQGTHARIMNWMEDGTIDIGLVRTPMDITHEYALHSYSKLSYIVALPKSHPLAKRKTIRIPDLKDEKLIIYPRRVSPTEYDHVMSMFMDEGQTQEIGQGAIEQHTILSLVSVGLGFAIMPESMKSFGIPGMCFKPLSGVKQRTGQAVLTRKSPDILVQNFLDIL